MQHFFTLLDDIRTQCETLLSSDTSRFDEDSLEDIVIIQESAQNLQEMLQEISQPHYEKHISIHELRTPLSAIIGFSEIIMDTTVLVGRQHNILQAIHSQGQQLLILINEAYG